MVNQDPSDFSSRGPTADGDILQRGQQLQELATQRLIEEINPPWTMVVGDFDETLSNLRTDFAEHHQVTISTSADQTITVDYGDGDAHTYYPTDSAAYLEVRDSLGWIVEKLQYFDHLAQNEEPLRSKVAELLDLRSNFNVAAAISRLVDGIPDAGEADNDPSTANDWSSLSAASIYFDGWKGEAATSFKINYVNRFNYYLGCQLGLLAVLHESLDIATAAYNAGHNDASALIDAAFIALDGGPDIDFDFDLQTTLTVFAAVLGVGAGIAAAIPTGGTSLAASAAANAALTVASGTASLGATVVQTLGQDGSKTPLEIPSGTALYTLNAFSQALDLVRDAVVQTERTTARWLGDFQNDLHATSTWTPAEGHGAVSVRAAFFAPLKPTLATFGSQHGDKSEGGLTDAESTEILEDAFQQDGIGTTSSVYENQVSADFDNLGKAAANISDTAADYGTFASALDGAATGTEAAFSDDAKLGDTGDAYVHAGATTNLLYPQWSSFHFMTVSIFDESHQNLSLVAEALELIVAAFDEVDWENANEIWKAGND